MRKTLALLFAVATLVIGCVKPNPPADHRVGVPNLGPSTDPRQTTYTNTSTMTPPSNGSWSTAQWYQSYAAGNDSNDCLTTTTACATIAEIQRRWGGTPVLPQVTTITALTTPTNAQMLADPWNVKALVTKGGNLTLSGPINSTTAACVGTLNTVLAKDRGVTSAERLLQSTFTLTNAADGAASCTIQAGYFVVNTTHAGRDWVHHLVSGSNWQLTQPSVAVANPFALAWSAEVDTWVTTDAVTLYQPVGINLVSFDVQPTDSQVSGLGAATSLYGQILNLTLLDPQQDDAGHNLDPVVIGPFVHILESWSNRPVIINSNLNNVAGFDNSVMAGGVSIMSSRSNVAGPLSTVFPATVIWGGAVGASSSALNELAGVVLDGDVLISGVVNVNNGSLGWVYIDTSSTLNGEEIIDVANHAVNPGTGIGFYDVWGPGTLNMAGTSRLLYQTGAGLAVRTFGDGGLGALKLNGQNSVVSVQVGDAAALYGRAFTPATLDTNCGASVPCSMCSNGGSCAATSVGNAP